MLKTLIKVLLNIVYEEEKSEMKKILTVFTVVLLLFNIVLMPTYGIGKDNRQITKKEQVIKFIDKNLESIIRKKINKPNGDIITSDVENIKELYADKKHIWSLQGIQYLTDLEVFSLQENNIKDIIPLAKLTKLKYLNLWKNDIVDITPLMGLLRLEKLDLDSNKIENVEALSNLKKLKALRIGSNRIKDITPLADLTNLEYLSLWSNKVEDISSLKNLTKLTQLRLAYNEIEDISSLKNLKRLREINLYNNKVRDIQALEGLFNLKKLYLMSNEIHDIGPLERLSMLEILRLDNNNISNISLLKDLINLEMVTLSKNNISNIYPLKKMEKLEYIDLRSNVIEDITVIGNLQSIKTLLLDHNHISNANPLSQANNLTTLSLQGNKIEDISPLSNLTNMYYLDLSHNQITDIQGVQSLKKLKWLYLDNNMIEDVSYLAGNMNLQKLSLSNNRIENILALSELKKLQYLDLSNNNIYDITSLFKRQNLKKVKTYNNPFEDSMDYRRLKKKGITVKGKVTDIFNDEYKGTDTYINMINIGQGSDVVLFDVTDKYGNFKMEKVLPGRYKIIFAKKGYKPLTIYKDIYSNESDINVKIEEQSEEKWIIKETEKIIYHYKKGIEISNREIDIQQNRLETIEDFFGVKLNEKINFYICSYPYEVYERAYDIQNYFALGTYKSDTSSIYTVGKTLDFHEITHAVEYKFNPNYNISLGEGLAVFFGDGDIGFPITLNRPVNDLARELIITNKMEDIKILLKSFDGENDYISMGSFVTFLLKRYSGDQFKKLFKELPQNPKDSDIERIFTNIYNKSISELESEWISYLKGDL
jgi:internalin A